MHYCERCDEPVGLLFTIIVDHGNGHTEKQEVCPDCVESCELSEEANLRQLTNTPADEYY